VQFKKFGTQLNFVPIVMGQGKIRLDLAPSVSQIDQTSPSQIPGSFLPLVIKQSMHASVEMECGQTLIMGGMYQTTNEAVIKKVPCLGDLPIVGAAFRRVSHVQREQELMVLVTPRLVHPLDPHQVPSHVPGDETCAPSNCDLYCHGLPEVPNCFDQPLRPQGSEFPAPLQYPQWEPAARGVPVQESLPQPTTMWRSPTGGPQMMPVAAMQRLPPPDADRRATPVQLPPPSGVAPVQWNAPLAGPPIYQVPNYPAGR
jgi:pilus assembly protein CpaC